MDSFQLNDHFAVSNILAFEETEEGLTKAIVNSSACTAELYLQGAHLALWQPRDQEAVLFLSERCIFAEGKALRGGVPIIFPWFGPRTRNSLSDRTDGPAHGFARTTNWTVSSATVIGDEVHLSLSLGPDENSSALGYDSFKLTYDVMMSSVLELKLTVENTGDQAFFFEEALHTYFAVEDARKVALFGLNDTEYLDKTDGYKRKRQEQEALTFKGETDRPYVNTAAEVELEDSLLKRIIGVEKGNSATTVIWNPWSELTAKMADMDPDGWQKMVCIEAANAGENGIILEAGGKHTMSVSVVVGKTF